MSRYIATFHTHLAALMTCRTLTEQGISARLMPVPRYLSSSCGTCVAYEAAQPRLEAMNEDVERVVELCSGDEPRLLLENL